MLAQREKKKKTRNNINRGHEKADKTNITTTRTRTHGVTKQRNQTDLLAFLGKRESGHYLRGDGRVFHKLCKENMMMERERNMLNR